MATKLQYNAFFFNADSQWLTGLSIVKYEVLGMSVFEDVFSVLTRSICKFSGMLYFVRKFQYGKYF